MIKYFVIVLLCFFSFRSISQVNISEDYLVEQLMDKYIQINQSVITIKGWRIQLASFQDRRKAEATKYAFMERFPDISCDWVHESPYYKVRAGAFATKLDALATLQDIKRNYRNAFPAFDKHINVQELIEKNY